ncbi:hypothetical protein [Bacteroides sp.]|uniref:hypothetical protein n=1 Tax=Bacteroides sp. TaxID=29523 RepID=UPI002622D86E|nr:hypothetical protein [Bacteroides sp.]
MIDFLSIVLLIFGVLQIILFFKMWRMTNNIKEMRDKYLKEGYPYGVSPAKIEFIIGNKEKAKEMAYREFISDVNILYIDISKNRIMSEEQEYTKEFEKLEKEFKEKYGDAASSIQFSEFSSFENAKKIFN